MIGPLINQVRLDKVRLQVEEAAATGAKVLCGGKCQRLCEVDDITLKVELEVGQEHNIGTVKAKLVQELRLKTNLGYNLEFHKYGTLPRYTNVKAKRFKDLRHKE